MQTRIVTWCVVISHGKRSAYFFYSRRKEALESLAAFEAKPPKGSTGGNLFKVTWRNVGGGTKSVIADLANLATLPAHDLELVINRLTSMATWEQI